MSDLTHEQEVAKYWDIHEGEYNPTDEGTLHFIPFQYYSDTSEPFIEHRNNDGKVVAVTPWHAVSHVVFKMPMEG